MSLERSGGCLCGAVRYRITALAALVGSEPPVDVAVCPPYTALAAAADALEPHRVANWLLETARLVHTWYHKHHVLGEAPEVMQARLALAKAVRITLANGLGLLGIAAPERM